MDLWILDTDCLSLLQRGNPTLIKRTSAVNAKQIAVTIVTAESQLRGRLDTMFESIFWERLKASLREIVEYTLRF